MEVFANAIAVAARRFRSDLSQTDGARHGSGIAPRQGLAGWLLNRVRPRETTRRLMLVDRICLAPRQSLALVEVDGQSVLIATAQESSPSFCLLSSGSRHLTQTAHDEVPFRGMVE